MKIEICENTFWVLVWIVVGFFACTALYVGMSVYSARVEAAFKAGYEETTTIGSGSLVWKKVQPTKP